MLQRLLTYLIVFTAGGAICALAQILVVKTKLTPARILVIFLVAGIIMQAVGLYERIHNVLRAGISVPIVGFGAALARGANQYAEQHGFIGAFAGGLAITAFGIGIAVVSSYIATLLFRAKSK
ncbi:MAG: SpoVA/SpoVAEb family sporulation membrane protein [Firmicutes bacterium]|nr:SpoVA/SpoVAEb family sporulation membrane protein [Bacillota bacterium]